MVPPPESLSSKHKRRGGGEGLDRDGNVRGGRLLDHVLFEDHGALKPMVPPIDR